MKIVDLHVHLLPGVDDGPTTLEETVGMLQAAHQGGTRTLVATPHMFLPPFDLEPPAVRAAFAEMTATLDDWSRRPGLEFLGELCLHLGAENNLSGEFLEALATHRVVSLDDGLYLLIEISPYFSPTMLGSAVERILGAGFFPVLAHVDRYPELMRHPARLAELVQMGLIVQLNASSLRARGVAQAAFALLEGGLVHVIASDGHDAGRRTPDQRPALDALRRRFSDHQIAVWMFENPLRILNNQSLM